MVLIVVSTAWSNSSAVAWVSWWLMVKLGLLLVPGGRLWPWVVHCIVPWLGDLLVMVHSTPLALHTWHALPSHMHLTLRALHHAQEACFLAMLPVSGAALLLVSLPAISHTRSHCWVALWQLCPLPLVVWLAWQRWRVSEVNYICNWCIHMLLHCNWWDVKLKVACTLSRQVLNKVIGGVIIEQHGFLHNGYISWQSLWTNNHSIYTNHNITYSTSSRHRKISWSDNSVITICTKSPFRQRWNFIAENTSSMGLKSGEYGGRNSQCIPLLNIRFICIGNYNTSTNLDSIILMMSGCLWMQQLSITIMEFGVGNGCI